MAGAGAGAGPSFPPIDPLLMASIIEQAKACVTEEENSGWTHYGRNGSKKQQFLIGEL